MAERMNEPKYKCKSWIQNKKIQPLNFGFFIGSVSRFNIKV